MGVGLTRAVRKSFRDRGHSVSLCALVSVGGIELSLGWDVGNMNDAVTLNDAAHVHFVALHV